MASVILSESIIPGTCQHPGDSPRPTMKAVLKGPNVAIRWRCGACRAVMSTVWAVSNSSAPVWTKRSEQAEGESDIHPENEDK